MAHVPPQNAAVPAPAKGQQALDLKQLWALLRALIDSILGATQQSKKAGCGECEELATRSLEDALCIARCQLDILACCNPTPEPPAKV